ncbi:54S ribosomal protein L9, mitochondrial [Serendipita sp. 399]|nr:54S ribosomal protein L9, mitochondrial [Serendipita sp. 399]
MPIPPPPIRMAPHRMPLAPERKPQAKVLPAPIRPSLEVKAQATAEAKADQPVVKISSQPREWTPQSRRVGLIALKKGMTTIWDDMGLRVPVTVQDNQVLSNILTPRGSGNPPYRAVQIGAKNISRRKVHIGMRGHFAKAKVPCKQYVKEFEVSEDAHLPIGMRLSAFHFVPGQYIDVRATTVGRGFQGVMRRWNFSGGSASHGNSLAHRTPGSTGQHQDPGRVWPGKKLPGRMGGKWRTMQNLYVARIDTDLNLIFVKGNVPGPDDGRTPVYITDAKKKVQSEALRIQLKSGGQGDWVTLDASGKPLPPGKASLQNSQTTVPNIGLGRGIVGLPFPAGSVAMAKRYAPILVAPSTRTTSPWAGGDGA